MNTASISAFGKVIRGVSWDKDDVTDTPRADYLPILRAGNIGNELNTTSDLVWVPASNVSAEQKIRAGDIAICMSSGSPAVVGKTASAAAEWPGSVGAFCALIRANPEKCLPEYLAFFLKSARFRKWTSEAQGANIKNIKKSELEGFEIWLPTLSEQRRIVDLLSRAEGIVRLRREAEKKAAELIPALFLDSFGDPATNPKGWPIQSVKSLVSFVSGGTPSKSRDDYWKGDLPWVSPKDMKRVGIDSAIDHVNRKILTETAIKLIPVGSVLIVVRGMILIHTVPVALSLVPLTINQDMKALIPVKSINGTYLLWSLRVRQEQLLNLVATAAHGTKKLDTQMLEAFSIPVPPLAMQKKFATNLANIESIQMQQVIALAKAQATFDALLAKAFAVDQITT